MPKGISINIGINELSDNYDEQLFRPLKSCVKDAEKMAEIAESIEGFEEPIILSDARATVRRVKEQIRRAAARLESNDICLITFSGHGGFRPDEDLDENDIFQKDESWCLHDRQMFDDEFFDLWTEFKDVRLLVVSDSCHSRTITDFFEPFRANKLSLLREGFDFRAFEDMLFHKNGSESTGISEKNLQKNSKILKKLSLESEISSLLPNKAELNFDEEIKTLLPQVIRKNFFDNKKIYDKARLDVKKNLERKMAANNVETVNQLRKASILLLAACADGDITRAGKESEDNSVYTKALLEVWNNGLFSGNYLQFDKEIFEKLNGQNNPQASCIFLTGTPNPEFVMQKPFTV